MGQNDLYDTHAAVLMRFLDNALNSEGIRRGCTGMTEQDRRLTHEAMVQLAAIGGASYGAVPPLCEFLAAR